MTAPARSGEADWNTVQPPSQHGQASSHSGLAGASFFHRARYCECTGAGVAGWATLGFTLGSSPAATSGFKEPGSVSHLFQSAWNNSEKLDLQTKRLR